MTSSRDTGRKMPARQVRIRILEALERTLKQFRTREVLYPLRVPREPVEFDAAIAHALEDDDPRVDPLSLRSRTVLHLEWSDGSTWDLWVIVLPSGLKLFCDSGEEGTRILASAGRNLGDESDRLFLERLAESAGDDFGIEMAGGVPSGVRSSIPDREFLVDVFVTLFEGTDVEASIRTDATAGGAAIEADLPTGRDFRGEVAAWLDRVMRSS